MRSKMKKRWNLNGEDWNSAAIGIFLNIFTCCYFGAFPTYRNDFDIKPVSGIERENVAWAYLRASGRRASLLGTPATEFPWRSLTS